MTFVLLLIITVYFNFLDGGKNTTIHLLIDFKSGSDSLWENNNYYYSNFHILNILK